MTGRTAAILFILSGVLALGGLALLGLPGALWLALASPVAAVLTDRRLPGDGAWPIAIIVTLLWPWAIMPAYLIAAWRRPPGRERVLVTIGLVVLGAVLLALVAQIMEGRA